MCNQNSKIRLCFKRYSETLYLYPVDNNTPANDMCIYKFDNNNLANPLWNYEKALASYSNNLIKDTDEINYIANLYTG